MSRVVYVMLLVLLLAVTADATILSVGRDGTADFTLLQDAIDAAAPGDTIQIGPGRYDEWNPIYWQGEEDGWGCAVIEKPDLTIRGVERGAVIIGPMELTYEVGGLPAVGVYHLAGGEGLRIENLTIENCLTNVANLTDALTIEACVLQGSKQALLGSGARGYRDITIRGCEFKNALRGPASIDLGSGADQVLIEGCQFENIGRAVLATGATNVIIRDAEVSMLGTAFHFVYGSTGTIEQCQLRSIDGNGVGIAVASGSSVDAHSIQISEVATGLLISNARFSGDSVDIWAARSRALDIGGDDNTFVEVHNGHFEHVGEYTAIIGVLGPDENVDLRHNDWGTDDLDLIWSWIHSGEDFGDEFPGYADPLIEPIMQTVPSRKGSTGGLKARFRRPVPEGRE